MTILCKYQVSIEKDAIERGRERERDYGVVVGIFCAAKTLGHMIVQTENCSFFYQGVVFIWVKQEHL